MNYSVTSRKSPENYTSKDLLSYWNSQYLKHQGTSYTSLRWGGLDLQEFKSLLQKYDVYAVLISIGEATKSGTIIGEFYSNFGDYNPQSAHPKLEWLVKDRGNKRHKILWSEYEEVSARWFPSSSDRKRILEIEEELKEWAK